MGKKGGEKMEVRKTVKLRVVGDNENLKELEKLLAIWRYSVIQKRKGINIDSFEIPTTYQVSLKNFNGFNIPMFHPILFNTGFSIDFDNNEVKLTSLKKYKRIVLKIGEENMEYLKKEINNGAKATEIMIIPPSYKKGHHKRREIVKNKHWKLYITLKKNVELLTKEEFKKFQRIAVIGVDLNSKHGVAYSLWIWNIKENSMKPVKCGFIKPKLKSHQFQEIEKWKLQMNHGFSVKYNSLYQRINAKIRRQNIAWVEKVSKMLINMALESIKQFNCEIAVISFENLKEYEAGNNSKRTNKINNEWLRGRIVQRVYEKSLWNYSMKILTYLPTFNKNQRNLRQILVDADGTTIYCSKCGSKGKLIKYIAKGKIKKFFKCNNCGYSNNKHFNAGNNIVKRAIEYLKKVASSDASELRRG
jgi:dihydroneopterin aldolase/transcription elongation factor Elf1